MLHYLPKRIIYSWLLLIALLPGKISAQQSLTTINGWNAYVHLPASYVTNPTQKYPTIIFFPGWGEVGTVASKVIANGPGAYITQGWNGNVVVNGNTVEFIVISLQPSAAFPTESNMNTKIQTIKSLYRVDPNRLFLTGLSHGGWCSSTFVTGDAYGGPYTYASQIAAIVTVQGMKPEDNQPYPNLFDNFALSGGKMIGFEQSLDGRDTRTVTDRMNATVPNSAIYVQTSFGGGGHCCWNQFYGGQGVQPVNFMLDGVSQNIYQWLARQSRGNVNQLPVANAGSDQTITLPLNYTSLSGSSTDPDGSVLTNLWLQVSGPNTADIFNVASPVTQINNLVQGQYKFSLKVTDNSGGSSTDTVTINVNPPAVSTCNTNAPVTYILGPTQPGEIYITDASVRPWKGGDTLKIPAGNYTVIEISNFKGDECNKLIITNMGGVVQTPTMRIKNNSRYFRLTGTGTPGVEYGFKINGGQLAISLAHDFEVDHVESTGGNLGMYIKATPDESQPLTIYTPGSPTNYLMKNIYLHHNWIHDISGEGLYIGHTGPSGGQNGNGSNGLPLIPLRLDNVEIAYNLIERTDWDGIQLSNARNNCKIHDNIVRDFGLINMSTQQSGIIMGGNTNGDVFNNTVLRGTGNGIEIFGYGLIKVYNNLVDSTGHDGTTIGQESVFANDIITLPETNPKQQIHFYNNTVNRPKPKAALRIGAYYSNSLASSVLNNQYCIPSAPANWLTSYVIANPTGSILTNNTLNCSALPPNQLPTANAGTDINITLPVNTTPLAGTGSDPDGGITGYLWTKISGPATGTIVNSTSATATANALVQGTYKFELRVTDNSGGIDRDTVNVIVNPAINQAPVANAGADLTLTLPASSGVLNGSGTDPDGTITSYSWTKVTGPLSGTIANAGSATASLSGLVLGIYQFQLRVTDNNGATATDVTTVIVLPLPNQSPSANAGADITITLPVNTASLNGTGTDPDGTIASYLWTKLSGPASGTLLNATSASASLSGLVAGTYQYQLRVTDNNGATANDAVTVLVLPQPNQAPAANAGSDITITLPVNTTSLNGSGSDPDGSIASYLWTKISGPASGTLLNPSSAIASLNGLVPGTYQYQLLVTDNNGATATDAVTVIVLPQPNQAPVANAGSDITITLPVNTASLNGSGSDPDGTIASYLWTKLSGPAAGTITNASSANASLSGLVMGTYEYQLSITDNSGAIATDLISVIILPQPNQAPVTNAGTDIIITLPVNTTPLSGSATDADGSVVNFLWSKLSGPASGTINNSTSAVATAIDLAEGVYQFNLQVTDNSGATSSDVVLVTVNAAVPLPNQIPVANAGIDRLITLPANSTVLLGSGSDPDGTIAAFQWTKISGPSSFSITNPAVAGTGVGALVQGIYLFELTVTDNVGASAKDTMQVTVNAPLPPPNQAPVANAGNDITITLPVNTINLNGTSSDPDGSIVSVIWSKTSGPATGTISNATSLATSVTGLTEGVYQFQLLVTDNNGATASDLITVTVNPAPNVAPVANAGSDIIITLPVNSTNLTGTASDPDGTIVSVMWSKISGPVSGTISNASSLTASAAGLTEGIYVFQLLVTDHNGATATDNITVTVNPAPNQAPLANAGADIIITLPVNSVAFTGTGSDADGTISGYFWTKISGPVSGSVMNANTANATAVNLTEGSYIFELAVSDNLGAVTTDTIMVTVNAAIPPPNQLPSANAGSDRNITLPVNSSVLIGNAMDPDGTIISYLWSKVSGPASFSITSPANASTGVGNLVQGVYEFELTVTDNSGGIAKDTMVITVNAAIPPNQAPIANAGNNISITLPVNSVTLTGSGTDNDGTISSYLWRKIEGPSSGTITNSTSGTTSVTGLSQGTYKFELQVADNNGATGKDTAEVVVNAAIPPPNQLPSALAGADKIITLPVNSTVLTGAGNDFDGTIISYRWSKISGPNNYSITNPDVAATGVGNLVAGSYKFELTVTDNNGGIGKDTMQVTVNPAPNQLPTAVAGLDQNLTLPASITYLNGSGTDPDGTITGFLWTKIAGPAAGSIINANQASTAVTGLVQGNYKFVLRVTDNAGATDTDTIQVNVNGAVIPPNQKPVANAGPDVQFNLPVNYTLLSGSATDADGTIVSYEWNMLSGSSQYNFSNALSAVTELTGLQQGVYKAELTVTDNNGGIDKDTVQISVGAARTEPVEGVRVYPNPVIDILNIEITTPKVDRKVVLMIVDVKGAVVLQKELEINQNVQIETIDMSRFTKGDYYLRVLSEETKQLSLKILKL